MPIRFGLQADAPSGQSAWLDSARRAEALGFDALYLGDHAGVVASPFTALSAAAAVTSTLRLGTYVCNCGVRDPLPLATDVATLDVVSDGRSVLGLGAGHNPAEWTMSGRTYPTARARVARLIEVADAVTALLHGDVVTMHGEHVSLEDARLLAPRPVQPKIPVLIGGNGTALLRYAARAADIVGLSGLTTTLADGHRHAVDWRPAAIDDRVRLVGEHAADPPPSLDALVQHVEITDDREAAAERVAGQIAGCSPADVLAAPYVLIGSVSQIEEELAAHRERWGISSYVVREAARDAIAALIERARAA
jgi:probable F420-dependent oxidoreductase